MQLELPAWVELMHLASEVVRVAGGIPAGGSGIVIPLGGVLEPAPPPAPDVRELVESLNAIVELLSASRQQLL